MGDSPPALPAVAERIHVVGIGGAGMSAIATVLVERGHRVSGSDQVDSAALDGLRGLGVEIAVGHHPRTVEGAAVVTYSSAVPHDDPERTAARAAGIPEWDRATVLAALTRERPTIAVAGTHGKTTTSAMLASALDRSGGDPSFVIGATVRGLGTAARWGGPSGWLVAEADESDGTFLELDRRAAVVTSIEADHLSHYGTVDALRGAFDRFVAETGGPVVVCMDDPAAASLVTAEGAIGYGTHADAEVRIVGHRSDGRRSSQVLHHRGRTHDLALAVPGLHNARNATAAFAVAVATGADPDAIVAALGRYEGVARRFELRGEVRGVTLIDDYAHLPTEIQAAVATAADGAWERIVVVFQPHRYSRTAELHETFADAFSGVDELIVTDIYPSGEAPLDGVSGALVADAVRLAHPDQRVRYIPDRSALVEILAAELGPGDLCLTLGAGDLTTIPDAVRGALEEAAS